MAQVTHTSTRYYVGITDVESSVQKREYSRNIDMYSTNFKYLLIQKKSSKEPRARTELWFLLASRF